jgi:hypothetical protein
MKKEFAKLALSLGYGPVDGMPGWVRKMASPVRFSDLVISNSGAGDGTFHFRIRLGTLDDLMPPEYQFGTAISYFLNVGEIVHESWSRQHRWQKGQIDLLGAELKSVALPFISSTLEYQAFRRLLESYLSDGFPKDPKSRRPVGAIGRIFSRDLAVGRPAGGFPAVEHMLGLICEEAGETIAAKKYLSSYRQHLLAPPLAPQAQAVDARILSLAKGC